MVPWCQLTESASGHSGALKASYDGAGNLVLLDVERQTACLPAGAKCHSKFAYDWDEESRLVRARRWDYGQSIPQGVPDAMAEAPEVDVLYRHSGPFRRIKGVSLGGQERHYNVEDFNSLALRRTRFGDGDHKHTAKTEQVVLGGLGRAVVNEDGMPRTGGVQPHVF